MEKIKSLFKEYDDTEQEILGISMDGSKNIYILGFKNEKNAQIAKELFENVTDYTVFNVDYFGKATLDEAEKYFSKNNKVIARSGKRSNTDIALKKNPDALIKQVYNLLNK